MIELKRVMYKGEYHGNTFDIPCWEGDSLDSIWNREKQWYLSGDKVVITDNHGKSKVFIRGLK